MRSLIWRITLGLMALVSTRGEVMEVMALYRDGHIDFSTMAGLSCALLVMCLVAILLVAGAPFRAWEDTP